MVKVSNNFAVLVAIAIATAMCLALVYNGYLAHQHFLAEERNFIEASFVVNAGPSALVVTDAKGFIRLSSPEFAHILGYEPQELTGLDIHDVMPEEAREPHREMLAAYVQKLMRYEGAWEDTRYIECEIQNKKGKMVAGLIVLRGIKKENDVAFIAAFRPKTDTGLSENIIRPLPPTAPPSSIFKK